MAVTRSRAEVVPCISEDAMALQRYMAELSRSAYDRSWIDHLEYALWYAMGRGSLRYGHIEIDDAIRAELRRLAIACGGWITRGMDDSFSLVPLSEWQDRFVARFDLVAMDTPVAPPGEMGGKD